MRFVRAIASVGKILGSKPVNPISLLQRDLAELTATIQGNPGQYPITFKLADGSPADVTCISRLARAEELRTNNPMETISIKSRSPSIEVSSDGKAFTRRSSVRNLYSARPGAYRRGC